MFCVWFEKNAKDSKNTEMYIYSENRCFGIIIEAFGTLNLNISRRSYQRKWCTDQQEQPRRECAAARANLQFRV